MDAKLSKNKLIRSIIIFVVVVAFVGVLVATQVFAWFAISDRQTNNFSVGVRSDIDMDILLSRDGQSWSKQNEVSFQNIFSGNANAQKLFVSITNKSTIDSYVSFSFYSPNEGNGVETPYYDIPNGQYYYLGSQLQVSQIKAYIGGNVIANDSFAIGKEQYLVNTTSIGVVKGQVTSVGTQVGSIAQLNLVSDLFVSANSNVVVEITITFVDNVTDQNAYQNTQNFGCSRKLKFSWEEI